MQRERVCGLGIGAQGLVFYACRYTRAEAVDPPGRRVCKRPSTVAVHVYIYMYIYNQTSTNFLTHENVKSQSSISQQRQQLSRKKTCLVEASCRVSDAVAWLHEWILWLTDSSPDWRTTASPSETPRAPSVWYAFPMARRASLAS